MTEIVMLVWLGDVANAAARAVQLAETTELGVEVHAALLRALRQVAQAK